MVVPLLTKLGRGRGCSENFSEEGENSRRCLSHRSLGAGGRGGRAETHTGRSGDQTKLERGLATWRTGEWDAPRLS